MEYTRQMREAWERSQRADRERMRRLAEEIRPSNAAERIWGRAPRDGAAVREAFIAAGKIKPS
jgi:hypothetical protein